MRFARVLASVWRPMRLVGFGLVFVSALFLTADPAQAGRLAGIGLVIVVSARFLHALRWPRFAAYLNSFDSIPGPTDWNPQPSGSSRSYLTWQASEPFLHRWIQGRQARGHRLAAINLGMGSRGLARQPTDVGTLPGQSGKSFIADMSKDQLSRFSPPSADLAEQLSAEEYDRLRATGVLPRWYWEALARRYADAS